MVFPEVLSKRCVCLNFMYLDIGLFSILFYFIFTSRKRKFYGVEDNTFTDTLILELDSGHG